MDIKRYIFKSALLLSFCASMAASATAMGLKENSNVRNNTITLGDVFYGLPHDQNRVLGNAPRPGEDMTINAQTLLRIATALDLPWRPSSSADYIVLHRAATVIETSEVKDSVIEALKDKGVTGDFDLLFSNENYKIVLPEDQPGTFEISKIKYNSSREWFEATIVAPSKDNPTIRNKISGKVQSMTEIPVLRASIRKGTIINDRDIAYISVPSKTLNHDTILNVKELLGKTPQRIAHGGKPIKAGDIESPRLIKRGDMITMIFENGSLTLTATGKALENGAKGDFIRVANSSSSRTVQAIVTGSKEVTVQSY